MENYHCSQLILVRYDDYSFLSLVSYVLHVIMMFIVRGQLHFTVDLKHCTLYKSFDPKMASGLISEHLFFKFCRGMPQTP